MKPGDIDVSAHMGGGCERLAPVLSRIGDKWTVLVIILLGRRSMRFNELKREIDTISQRMLTFTLRGLERDGLVTRTVQASVPPRVDYALTPLGFSLLVPIEHLGAWAVVNMPEIEEAQEKYDAGSQAA